MTTSNNSTAALGTGNFEITKYSDLYHKANHDFIHMEANIRPFNVWNFVLTVNCLLDWARYDQTLSQSARNEAESLYQDSLDDSKASFLRTIRKLCNCSKHFKHQSSTPKNYKNRSDMSKPPGYLVEYDGQDVPFLAVAHETMEIWHNFSDKYLGYRYQGYERVVGNATT